MVLGVLRHVCVGPEVCLGLESQLFGLLLGHDESGGGAVGQVGRVGGRHRPLGLDEGGLQLGQLLGWGDADSVVLREYKEEAMITLKLQEVIVIFRGKQYLIIF